MQTHYIFIPLYLHFYYLSNLNGKKKYIYISLEDALDTFDTLLPRKKRGTRARTRRYDATEMRKKERRNVNRAEGKKDRARIREFATRGRVSPILIFVLSVCRRVELEICVNRALPSVRRTVAAFRYTAGNIPLARDRFIFETKLCMRATVEYGVSEALSRVSPIGNRSER